MPKDDDVAKDIATHILYEEVSRLQENPHLLLAPGNEALLQGVLQLVKELSSALGKVSLGVAGSDKPGLVELLLKR